jgi:hypothetical protein
MIWIVGENADRIDNAGDILETFLDSFLDEIAEVQLAVSVSFLLVRTIRYFQPN